MGPVPLGLLEGLGVEARLQDASLSEDQHETSRSPKIDTVWTVWPKMNTVWPKIDTLWLEGIGGDW